MAFYYKAKAIFAKEVRHVSGWSISCLWKLFVHPGKGESSFAAPDAQGDLGHIILSKCVDELALEEAAKKICNLKCGLCPVKEEDFAGCSVVCHEDVRPWKCWVAHFWSQAAERTRRLLQKAGVRLRLVSASLHQSGRRCGGRRQTRKPLKQVLRGNILFFNMFYGENSNEMPISSIISSSFRDMECP